METVCNLLGTESVSTQTGYLALTGGQDLDGSVHAELAELLHQLRDFILVIDGVSRTEGQQTVLDLGRPAQHRIILFPKMKRAHQQSDGRHHENEDDNQHSHSGPASFYLPLLLRDLFLLVGEVALKLQFGHHTGSLSAIERVGQGLDILHVADGLPRVDVLEGHRQVL